MPSPRTIPFTLLALIVLFVSGCGGCSGSVGSNRTPTPSPTASSSVQSHGIDPTLLAKAQAGDPDAERHVGWEYDKGKEVPQDFAKATMWYQKAAEQGNAKAQTNLGLMYEYGQGIPQDYAEALRWYRMAAEQGDAGAESELGLLYGRGKGVPQDYAQANAWFREAAEQGDATAQFNLGISYYSGIGLPPDHAQAAMWFRKAAEQGNTGAKEYLDKIQSENEGSKIRSYWPTTIRVDTDMDSFWLPDEERTCQTYPNDKGRIAVVACSQSGSHRRDHNIPVTFWGDPDRNTVSDWKCRREKGVLSDTFACRAID
jgi:hypothetical protein